MTATATPVKIERRIVSFSVSEEWSKAIAHAATDAGVDRTQYVRSVLANAMAWDLSREPSTDTRLSAKKLQQLQAIDALRAAGMDVLAEQIATLFGLNKPAAVATAK